MNKEKLPKKQWGPGPWQDEPDEVRWVDKDSGLNCFIWRGVPVGSLNGYVGVPSTHPAHGLSYSGITQTEHDEEMARFRATMRSGREDPLKAIMEDDSPRAKTIPGIGEAVLDIRVHGGLTFAGPMDNGLDPSLWWFGFDCAHAGDLSPGLEAILKRIHIDEGRTNARYRQYKDEYADVYRNLNYVRAQVTSLAQQLKAMERPHYVPVKSDSQSGSS